MPDKDPSGTPALDEEFLRRLVSSSPIPLVATDPELRIVCWNDAAGEVFGVAPDEMLGRSIYDLVPEERRKLLGKLLRRTLQSGQTTRLEIRPTTDAGKSRNLVFILSPIGGGGAGTGGVAAWILDETDRTRLSGRIAQGERMTSLGTLAEGVAHHFNNILGGVATFVDFALTSGDPVSMKRALQMTGEAVARVSRITQSLLSFTRKDAHQTDLADLTEVVLTFSHLIEHPLAEQNYQLQLELNAVPIIAVEANRMHQVLGNLLTNAEEAMPDGGTITVGIDGGEDEVTLTFADTGCGINPEHIPLVFEPFFTTKGLLAGGDRANPGLGLSVVHGILTEMGARIEVESKVGEGARFLIHFPAPAAGG